MSNPTTIILKGPNDWELWIYTVKRLAEAADVWEYIDPNQANQSLQKPTKPIDPAALSADGSPPTQPTEAAVSRFDRDLSNYHKEIKEYRRLKDKLGQVEAHVTKSIAQDLLYHIKDQDTHFWGQCPYIDTSLRSSGFVEDPEKAKKVTDFDAKDEKGILNRIREKNRRFKKQKKSPNKGSDKRGESDFFHRDRRWR